MATGFLAFAAYLALLDQCRALAGRMAVAGAALVAGAILLAVAVKAFGGMPMRSRSRSVQRLGAGRAVRGAVHGPAIRASSPAWRRRRPRSSRCCARWATEAAGLQAGASHRRGRTAQKPATSISSARPGRLDPGLVQQGAGSPNRQAFQRLAQHFRLWPKAASVDRLQRLPRRRPRISAGRNSTTLRSDFRRRREGGGRHVEQDVASRSASRRARRAGRNRRASRGVATMRSATSRWNISTMRS